jgi:ABC-type transport system involved in cytochrome bd biosynthesis fused ATPase/permease subunit
LLRDAPLYIFDEPTANLDLVTAREVIQNLLWWAKQSAMILISHQAIGFEQMDDILVIEAGYIAQRGKHLDLLITNQYYAQLWHQ